MAPLALQMLVARFPSFWLEGCLRTIMTVHIAAISYGALFAFHSGNSVEIFIFITITTTINVISVVTMTSTNVIVVSFPIAPLSRYAFHCSIWLCRRAIEAVEKIA